MSNNDYYRTTPQSSQPLQQYEPYTLSDIPPSRDDRHYYGHTVPSEYNPDELRFHGDPQSTTTHYTQDIPLKDQTRIQTNPNEWLAEQHTAYPPRSPESQNPNPALLSSSSKEKQRRKKTKKKRGFFTGKVPWFVYFITFVQITVFIVEIIKNSIITGSPIMTKPSFNPMIGPSTYVLINMGARFVPCMRTTYNPNSKDAYPLQPWPCPNTTSNLYSDANNQCYLGELCGLGAAKDTQPTQWFRFITPMFLHAGIIHIGFNMLLQMTLGRDMEKAIGTLRFMLVYLSSGIFGFVLGGNFAAPAIASTGASGCLFGIFALVLLDIFYTWNERPSPGKDLLWILFDILISFVLGLLPGLDNFSHIGGFLMGLVLGICILHSPSSLRKRNGEGSHKTSYSHLGSQSDVAIASGAVQDETKPSVLVTSTTVRPADLTKFAKQPVGFFKNRKPAWWVWWLIRVGCLIGVLIGFVVLLSNFYNFRDECKWCKYLSCLDIEVGGQNWCDMGYMTFPDSGQKAKRVVNMVFARVFHA